MGEGHGLVAAVSSAAQPRTPAPPLGRQGPQEPAALGAGPLQEAERHSHFFLTPHLSCTKLQLPWVTKVPHAAFGQQGIQRQQQGRFRWRAGSREAEGRARGEWEGKRGGSEWGEEGRPWLPGWLRPGGGWNLPSQIQDDQTRLHTQTEVKASCCQGGARPTRTNRCMRKTPCSTAPGPPSGKRPMLACRRTYRGQAGPSAPCGWVSGPDSFSWETEGGETTGLLTNKQRDAAFHMEMRGQPHPPSTTQNPVGEASWQPSHLQKGN